MEAYALSPDGAHRKAHVQSVARAMTVLDTLREATEPLPAHAVAHACGLDRAVVHRLLKTLAVGGLVSEQGGAYGLGPAVVLLANRYLAERSLRRVAVPYLLDLQTHAIGDRPWTVALSIPVKAVTTVIERLWSRAAPLAMVLDIGDTFPIDATAVGRCLLAYESPERVVGLVGEARAAAVVGALAEIRANDGIGLARDVAGGAIEGVAAAIRSRRGEPLAGLAVAGVDLGEQLDVRSPLARSLRRAADSIGQLV